MFATFATTFATFPTTFPTKSRKHGRKISQTFPVQDAARV
jgi:hypothetical protein